MTQPPELPSVEFGRDPEASFDRPAERLHHVLALSALLGLLSGLGEALIDVMTPPFSGLDLLYVTVVANLLLFLLVGLFFWLLGLGLKRQLAYFLVLFILLWALLRGWASEFAPRPQWDFVWLLSTAGTCLLAVLLAAWAWKHTQKVARIAGTTLPWVTGILLTIFLAIPVYRLEVRRHATQIAQLAAGNGPNVVLIIVDALRADHLSGYGYGRSTSPNLDELAAKGVVFENAIATSSWTLPSHASMLTGVYPNQHRAKRFQDHLGVNFPTLPEELQRVGYRTGAFSGSPFFTPRQGLGRGFMEFEDFSLSPVQVFTQAHDIGSILRQIGKTEWVAENIGHPSAIDINRSVIQWIDKVHAPFFLAVNYFEVHEPSSTPRTWRQRFSARQASENLNSDKNRLAVSQPLQIQKKIDEYDAAVAYDDERIQKLIDELERRHLMDNTLLIVTADHGEGLGEHGLLVHGTALYYPLVHVPLYFSWPGHLPAGVRITRPVSIKDIPATILEIVSASHSQLPGQSLAALWNRQTPPDEWPMPVSELIRQTWRAGKASEDQGEVESIISSEFQFIFDSRDGPSLYNWQEDPQERENLFLAPRYDTISRWLSTELKTDE
jgi:arylsulfatase A-like enzyme